MDNLDEYLVGEYHKDRQDLTKLEQSIRDVGLTLCASFDKVRAWPYGLRRGSKKNGYSFSQGTTAMVALSLYKLVGYWSKPRGYSPSDEFPRLRFSVDENDDEKAAGGILAAANSATSLLLAEMTKGANVSTDSGTFGTNDPLTLFYITDFFSLKQRPGEVQKWTRVRSYIKQRCHDLCADDMVFDRTSMYLGRAALSSVSILGQEDGGILTRWVGSLRKLSQPAFELD